MNESILMISVAIFGGSCMLSIAHVWAARIRARGAVDAAHATAPIFAATGGGTMCVNVHDVGADTSAERPQ